MQDRIDEGQVNVQPVVRVEQRHEVLVVTIIVAAAVVAILTVVTIGGGTLGGGVVTLTLGAPAPGVIHVVQQCIVGAGIGASE